MKKSFLIAGLIAGLTATNGYAVQSQGQSQEWYFFCPEGCTLVIATALNGDFEAHCMGADGNECNAKPDIELTRPTTTNFTSKTPKQKITTSARTATNAPNMVKKIVYEEIITDDAE
jgi:hypothetical protein